MKAGSRPSPDPLPSVPSPEVRLSFVIGRVVPGENTRGREAGGWRREEGRRPLYLRGPEVTLLETLEDSLLVSC